MEKNSTDTSLKILALNQPSDIKIVPFARLSFREKPDVTATFGLKAEFKNAADNVHLQSAYIITSVKKEHR